MKLVIAFLAIIGFVCATPFYRTDNKDVKIADKAFLEKQKFLFEILYRVEDPLMFEEWIKYGEKIPVDKSFYSEYDFYMEKFYESYKLGAVLPRGEFFGALVKTHLKQAYGLFGFFYYAKDWETFKHNVAWARIHVNEGMFVYALTLAVIHRDDFQGLILPAIYEIFPQYFFPSKFIYEAEKFDYDVWSKYIMYEKEFYDVYYRNNKYYTEDYFYIKDWKVWQWWKLFGLDEHWYPETSYFLRENIYEFNQDPKWQSFYKDLKVFWYPVDYTRDVKFFNEHSKLSYFTEDLGWNSYWYYLNMDYGFFLNGYKYDLDKDRRGEYWIYNVQQLLARYYMERLSHGFGEIPQFSFYTPIKYGYDPELIDYSGVGFSYRKNYWEIKYYDNFEMLNYVTGAIQRIHNIADSGYYRTKDDKVIDLTKPESIHFLYKALQGNFDGFDKYDKYDTLFFQYWYLFSHMLFADVKFDQYEVTPNTWLNFETMARDPLFYVFYKEIVTAFYRFKFHFQPYTHEELAWPGVEIKSADVSKLVTYFDLVDTDVTNLLNDKVRFVDGKFVWDKTLVARQRRLNHKPFTYDITVQSDKAQKAVVVAFYAPKYDEFGQTIPLSEVYNWVEIDKFVVPLTAGKNEIKRNSDDFYWTIKDRTTYTELYQYVLMAYEGKYDFPLDISEPHCGFPDRLLLPRGWPSGYPVQFFFYVYPYTAEYEQYSTYDYTYSCGIGSGVRYPDKLPFGYPFNRYIDEYDFLVPNMYFKDENIYHEKVFETYYGNYKNFGHFDYAFFNNYYTKYFH